ncbi:hypothetical protein M409DRAFT_18769 [Zasmidium cellare ATCC 36951]|uniref:Chromatin assembly factor 1 subunit A n=1 Tax=Zasmidium cellare ATCC 36951 TaxID=1080233 RepID=A0A6A6CZJ8_ZASCE|nr:uncharacterized protein M409DRAFT_18769 [Zasmidium cellare ATCC 36951]KAF2170796.1 hypothetical protein M409DRAFT_18769 [Zasmidium cellare ATCC 36951]
MDDIVSSPLEPNYKKRPAPEDGSPDKKPLNLKGNQFMMPTPPDTDNSSNVSPEADANNDEATRAASPAPSSSAMSSVIENTHDTSAESSAPTVGASSSGPPPAKRRKLTPTERLEKQQAKEAKDRAKAEEKARKDEQKRVRDEEKRRKAEELEAKKREKELKEEQKVQEKLKKERSQMRLGAFFQRGPATPAKPDNATTDGDEDAAIRARRRSLSLELYDDVADNIKTPAKGTPPPPSAKKECVKSVSDYQKTFLAFQLQSHCRMPPIAQPASEAAQDAFEQELKDPSLKEKFDLGLIDSYEAPTETKHYFAGHPERGMPDPDIKALIDTIAGTSHQPIDLTGESSTEGALARLHGLSIKHLQFYEDVRPAYCGTYTKIRSPRAVRKVTRNPFTRARPDTDYDYDSEAEWEEPKEDDEELLSDDEDEGDSQADGNEINDFLDDEDDDKNKRKVITSELVPESTGLCWIDSTGRNEQEKELQGMRMGVLLPAFSGTTIDPFSTEYWDSPSYQVPALQVNEKPAAASTPMAPPRVPLQPRLNTNGSIDKKHDLLGAAAGEKGAITSVVAVVQGAKRGPKPAPKTLSKEDMDEFKEAVIGSPIGKLELQKGLKARFPKMTNEVIKETLSSQFAQVGKGKADKRWVFVGES